VPLVPIPRVRPPPGGRGFGSTSCRPRTTWARMWTSSRSGLDVMWGGHW